MRVQTVPHENEDGFGMSGRKIILTLHMLGQGGTDRVACLLASGFANAGYDTTLLIFCDGGKAMKTLRALICGDVKLVFLGHSSGSRPKDLARNLRGCVRFLASARPDYVLSTGNNMNWMTALAVQLSGIDTKLVMKTTNPIIRAKDGRIKRVIRKLGYRIAFHQADMVLPLSDAERTQLIDAFPASTSKFRTVINPYVTPQMLERTDMPPACPDAKIILGAGRFQAQKRFDRLIRAFARVEDPAAKLVILGDGPGKSACEALIGELGIADRVLLPSFVSDIAAWYQSARVFVLSSDYEGLPAVVLEALAGNCPVLSTDCFPAAREILEPLDGCAIIDPPSIENMAAFMDVALEREQAGDLRLAARKYSIENGIDSHLASLLSLWQPATMPEGWPVTA